MTDQTLTSDVSMLKTDVYNLKKETALLQEMNKTMQQRLANLDLRIDDEVKNDLQALRGKVDEQQNIVQKSLKQVQGRLVRLEGGQSGLSPYGLEGPQPPSTTTPQKFGSLDPEEMYAAAYDVYKEGRFDEARGEFRKFLNQFPQTEFSDNAQFWIAECYFKEGKYEEAILAYEEVVKKYPKGNKVPDALLKQGICFGALGDKDSSRILLQRVIETYPDSPQAETARKELQKLS